MPVDTPPPAHTAAPRYWAFISYSHRDAAIAARLQRALETYRIPRSLQGRATPAGEPVPRYFKPVFRDRDDLQASPDLKGHVQAALAQSHYLIVICSPDAARSEWVNDEIVEFKRLHGDHRVLALIASGEPFGSERSEHVDDECFPEALRFDTVPQRIEGDATAAPAPTRDRAAEPIAADLRPQGDGERLATFKLIAGMLGVGVDTLVRRDAHRRNQRMARVALASLVGVVVMAGLTFMAMQARNDAQRERAQAESLVEFMLTDLRKKLDPVGRLDILDSIANKALEHYAQQQSDDLDANALGRKARALHLIGEMRAERAQLDDAMTAFQSAAASTAALLARSPHDGQRIFDHAQSVFFIGDLARRRGDDNLAAASFAQYGALTDQLVALDPRNDDWQLESAYASVALGVLQLDQRQLSAALVSLRRSQAVFARLVPTRPELATDLNDNEAWISEAQEAGGDYGAAIETQLRRIAVARQVTDMTTDRQSQVTVANANNNLARLELLRGNAAAAQQYAEESVRLAEALVQADPANRSWLADATFFRLTLLQVQQARRGADDAAALELLRARYTTLAAVKPTPVTWQVNLQGRLLLAEYSAGRASIASLRDYLQVIRTVGAPNRTLTSLQQALVATLDLRLGDLLARSGRDVDARAHWQAAATRLASSTDATSHAALAVLALADARLGATADAVKTARLVTDSAYRGPDYAEMVAAVGALAVQGNAAVLARTRE